MKTSFQFAVRGVLGLALGLGLLAASGQAQAQGAYPNRPVRLIVPYAAGGGLDVIARTIAQKMTEGMGQTVFVENRAGAGGAIGSEATAKSAPDGYTLMMMTDALTMLPALQKVGWDPVKDFTPIGTVGTYNLALIASPKLQARSVAEMVKLAKSSPGKLQYSSSGIGSAAHIAMEVLKKAAGIEIEHVPYKGLSESVTAVIAGDVALGINGMAAVPHVKSGAVLGLGVTGKQRWSVLPEVPTIAEAGVPGYAFEGWIGILASPGLPADLTRHLNAQVAKAVGSPEVREKLVVAGFDPKAGSAQEFAAQVAADTDRFSKLITGMGLSPK